MKAKITTIPIKWEQVNSCLFTLNCPICGKIWEETGENTIASSQLTPCEHLRFRLIEGFEIEWLGEWDHRNFDIMNIQTDDIDMIVSLEEVGTGCGPVSTKISYGVWSGVKK